METRKDAAASFLRMVASGRAREAYARYVAPGMRHHNALFAGDAGSLQAAMEEDARANPQKRLDVVHSLEDGDLVAVHSHVRQAPEDRGWALMHLFRFEADRIVEMWDVAQAVPAETVNENGMF